MKTLYIARHAKSSWNDSSLADIDRPLNNRGIKNAPVMAERLTEKTDSIDTVLSSPANRAFTTARTLVAAIGIPANQIIIEPDLYFRGVSAMIEIIQNVPADSESLMVVGHNPDMTSLLNWFCETDISNMPTCSIATIGIDSEWSKISTGLGQLIDFDYPKK